MTKRIKKSCDALFGALMLTGLALSVLTNSTAHAAPLSFAPKADYATGTGSNPFSVTSGDFNGDGKLDLAVANQGSDTASVLLGSGSGTFAAHVDYATGSNSISVTSGDFNGDGKLDLAVTNGRSSTVSVLIGSGSGTFAANLDYATGANPKSVTSGDFDGDGKLDLATANSSSDTVSVLIGSGSGTFAANLDYATGGLPKSVMSGDFNGDGKPDLAIANQSSGTASVLLNTTVFPPSLSINDVAVTEGNSGTTNAIFTVTLSVASSQMVTVAYGAIKGSTNPATVNSDFLSTKGTLTFAPGEMTKTVTVPIVGDYVPEADETFIVKLSSPVNVPINDGQGLGTITNDDFDTTPPTVSFTTSTTTPMGTTPQTGGTVYNVIPAITGVATDAGSGIARVQLRLYRLTSTAGVYEYWNGTGWVIPGGNVAIPMLITVLSPGAGSANVTWTRSTALPTGSNLADGTYYLTAYAYDRAGKFASSSRNFKKAIDSTGPSVSFTTSATTPVGTTPVSGGTVSNTMPTITGIAADSASGVAKVELRLYRATATAGVYENWTGSVWTTTLAALSTVMNPTVGGTNVSWTRSTGWPGGGDFADGSYYLRATAYDKAGNLTATLASNFMKVSSAGQTLQPFATDEPSQ